MIINSLISFVIFFVGLEFGFRILRGENENLRAQSATLTKIGTVFVLVQIFFAILLKSNHFLIFFAQIGLVCTYLARIFFENWQNQRRERESSFDFLNQIIIRMRSGESFRSSAHHLIQQHSCWSKWSAAVLFQPQKKFHSVWQEEHLLYREFLNIHQHPHQALPRLLALREQLSKLSDFRRRSGQVLMQIRMQAVVLLVMQIALSIFVIWKWGLKNQVGLLILASVLHALGLLTLALMGRKVKWTL